MWGPRAQIDRSLYKQHLQHELFCNTPNLQVMVASVEDLLLCDPGNSDAIQKCFGVILGKSFDVRKANVLAESSISSTMIS